MVSYRAASWEDNSLVKIFGATLASELCPMAIILEYFPLGPLDAYLKYDFFLLVLRLFPEYSFSWHYFLNGIARINLT